MNTIKDLVYSIQLKSCFFSFEMTAIVIGRIDFLRSNPDGIVYIEKFETFKNTSLEKISFILKEKEKSITRRISCNSNLLIDMMHDYYFSKKDVEFVDLEDDEKQLKELSDLYKGWKADNVLIENVEVPTAIKHLKIAHLSFIHLAVLERKRPNAVWMMLIADEKPDYEVRYNWETGQRIN